MLGGRGTALLLERADFFRFWDVRNIIFGNFGGPGTYFGDLGPHFEDFRDYCDFTSAFSAKKESIFEVTLQAVTHFLVLRFLCFFRWSLFWIF